MEIIATITELLAGHISPGRVPARVGAAQFGDLHAQPTARPAYRTSPAISLLMRLLQHQTDLP